ncbi:MAG: class I SAM-dependent methyltransferase [Rubripirellula sp.]
MTSWYDHPHYFDLIFRDETEMEVSFFEKAFEQFVPGAVKRILEPGCGSGRLVVAMAQKGYDVTGLDLNQPMLDYMVSQLKAEGVSAAAVLGDMTAMDFDEKFDAAFCTFNTFRHLTSTDAALKHLRNVADQLRDGGIYILGLHLIPMDADPECTEKWKASDEHVKLKAKLKVVDFNRKTRLERLRVAIKARKPSGEIERVKSEFSLRIYTPKQMKKLLGKVEDVFEIASIHDMDYEIDETRKFNKNLTDAVFILKRRER